MDNTPADKFREYVRKLDKPLGTIGSLLARELMDYIDDLEARAARLDQIATIIEQDRGNDADMEGFQGHGPPTPPL